MATQIPVVLLGTSPNFTGIGELQTVDTLAGVFNHADLAANSLAAKVGTAPGPLNVADNSLVGRVGGSNLGAMSANQLATLMASVLDRAGSGFSDTGQFIAYQAGTGFVAVSPGADGEALVFDSAALGGISAAAVASQLNGLADVTISSPTAAQTLRYDGADFVNAALSVDDLSDVDITTAAPTDGQVLAWDNANSKFAPVDQTGGGGTFDPATDLADIAGNPIGNAQSLTLTSGSSVTEATGELTLTSSTNTVTVDDQLNINTLPSVTTPTNVVTSNAGVMSVSTIAQLAAQITVGDLSEVDLTGLVAGQTLAWSGTQWEPSAVASQLNGLSDVTINSPTTNHFLVNDGAGNFVNRLATLNDLDNVLIGTPANGDILAWSTTNSRFESVAPNATGYVPGNSFGGANLPDVGDITLDAQGGGDHRIDDSGNDLRLTSAGGTLLVAGAINLGTTAAEATPTTVATLNAGTIVSSTIAQLANQITLGDLDEVDLTGLSIGQTLTWSGTQWEPGSAASSQLDGLSDVTITSVSTGQFLAYDGANFVNRFATLNDMDNVQVGSPSNGDILAWNTTNARFESVAPNATGYVPGNSFGGANLPDVGDITLDAQGGGDHRIEDSSNNLSITPAGGTLIVAGAIELNTTNPNATPSTVATFNGAEITSSTVAELAGQIDVNDLQDVNAPTPNNGETLVWNSATSKWVPGEAGSIGSITSDLDMQGNYLIDYPGPETTPDTVVSNIAYREPSQGALFTLDLDALPETGAAETTDELLHKTSAGNLERLALENLPAHPDAGSAAAARTAGELWTAAEDNYLGLPTGTLVTGQSGAAAGTAAEAATSQVQALWSMNRFGDSEGLEILPSTATRHAPTARVATGNIPTEAFSDGLMVKCAVSGTFVPGSANPGLTLGFQFGDAEKYTGGEHTPDLTYLYPPVTGIRGYGAALQAFYTEETSGILASYLNLGTNALWHGYDAETSRGNELLWNCDATLTFEGGISSASRVRVRGELTYNRPLDNIHSTGSILSGRRNVYDLRDNFPTLPLSVLPGARASIHQQEYFPYAQISAATGFVSLSQEQTVTNLNKNYALLAFSGPLANDDTVTIDDGITGLTTYTAKNSSSVTNEFDHGSTAQETAAALTDAINHSGKQVMARLDGTSVRLYSRDRSIVYQPYTPNPPIPQPQAPITCSNGAVCTITTWTGDENVDNRAMLDRMLTIMPGVGEDWRRYWYPRVERIPFDFVKEVDTTQEGLSLTLLAGGATMTNTSDSEFVTWTAGLDTPIAGASTRFSGSGFAGLYPAGPNETPNELREGENYIANVTVDGVSYERRIRYDGKQMALTSTQRDNYVFSYMEDLDFRTTTGNNDGKNEGVLAAGATTITLETGQGANFYTNGGYAQINNVEIVQYSGVSGDTLTGVTRGVAGSTDQEHADGKFIINVAVGTLRREAGSGDAIQAIGGGGDAEFVFSNFARTNSANPMVFYDGKMWVSRVESNLYDSQNPPSTAEDQPGTFDWRPLAPDGADQMTVTSTFAWMIGGRVGQTD